MASIFPPLIPTRGFLDLAVAMPNIEPILPLISAFWACHRRYGTFTPGSTYLLSPAGRSDEFLQVKEIANGASRVQTLPHLGRRTRPQARTNEKTPRRGRSETTRTSDAGFLATRNFPVGKEGLVISLYATF